MAPSATKKAPAAVVLLGMLLFGFWGAWRWFNVAGGPWEAGHSCSTLIACKDGLCLIHARPKAGADLAEVPGYCSKRCDTDADCPADMACEALPAGISNKAGDHLPMIQLPERLCVRGGRSSPEKG
ncbi:MAG: hypothetical protein EXR72_26540 [Myxococcales bacterium]|nr:hypothetical protein [Myxococcales bacterium]